MNVVRLLCPLWFYLKGSQRFALISGPQPAAHSQITHHRGHTMECEIGIKILSLPSKSDSLKLSIHANLFHFFVASLESSSDIDNR